MNICTITCHRVNNYGASLQACALARSLKERGNDARIVDYVLPYMRYYSDPWLVEQSSKYYNLCQRSRIVKFLYCAIRNHRMFLPNSRRARFLDFERRFMPLTRHYETYEDLKANPPKADLYIAGSDQIWNTDMPNGNHEAYWLGFAPKGKPRCAYAASFGISQLKEEDKPRIRMHLKSFDMVSVREQSGVRIIQDLGLSNAVCVVDPVFLLSREDWLHMSANAKKYNVKSGGYILVYDFLWSNPRLIEFTKMLSQRNSLPVVAITGGQRCRFATRSITNAGPLEFVDLVANAAFVVSSSFHATAFSIILEKEFYTFSDTGMKNSSRMRDLLSMLQITDRLNPEKEASAPLHYAEIKQRLSKEIAASERFLEKIL